MVKALNEFDPVSALTPKLGFILQNVVSSAGIERPTLATNPCWDLTAGALFQVQTDVSIKINTRFGEFAENRFGNDSLIQFGDKRGIERFQVDLAVQLYQ